MINKLELCNLKNLIIWIMSFKVFKDQKNEGSKITSSLRTNFKSFDL